MPEIQPTVPVAEPELDARALLALAKQRNFSAERVQLLLHLKEAMLVAMGLVLGRWRESRDPVSGAFAEHCQAELKLLEIRKALEIIRGRIIRMPPAQRKRYSPHERFQIVDFVKTFNLTLTGAAETFLVDTQTIRRWMHEATQEPDRKTVGSLLKATPPIRSFDDVTRELVGHLDAMGVGGSKTIAQMLLRAGRKIGVETVRCMRKTARRVAPSPAPPPVEETARPRAVRASQPNHSWMTDITTISSFCRIWFFKLVVVLDVYSRFPLVFRVFWKEPTTEEIAALVQSAADKFGAPRHFVTDRGAQFTSQAFTAQLEKLGTKQRFGAIGQSGSIAVIERFWRTVKEMLRVKFRPPLSRRHLEDDLAVALNYYATLRPHQGLAGATPAEMYFGLTPVTQGAVTPPRATWRAGPGRQPPPHRRARGSRETAAVFDSATPRRVGGIVNTARIAQVGVPPTLPGVCPSAARAHPIDYVPRHSARVKRAPPRRGHRSLRITERAPAAAIPIGVLQRE